MVDMTGPTRWVLAWVWNYSEPQGLVREGHDGPNLQCDNSSATASLFVPGMRVVDVSWVGEGSCQQVAESQEPGIDVRNLGELQSTASRLSAILALAPTRLLDSSSRETQNSPLVFPKPAVSLRPIDPFFFVARSCNNIRVALSPCPVLLLRHPIELLSGRASAQGNCTSRIAREQACGLTSICAAYSSIRQTTATNTKALTSITVLTHDSTAHLLVASPCSPSPLVSQARCFCCLALRGLAGPSPPRGRLH